MTKKSIRLDIDESVHANLKAQAALEGVGLIVFLTREVVHISKRPLKRRR